MARLCSFIWISRGFKEYLDSRIRIFLGDLTDRAFRPRRRRLRRPCPHHDSVIHCAASLNRKSEKSCLNVNLRGTLEVIQLAMRARDHHGLRRSATSAPSPWPGTARMKWCKKTRRSIGTARTTIPTREPKNSASTWSVNCCPMCRARFFVRASFWGTAAAPETNQFDMVRAFVFLAGLPALPFRPTDRSRHRSG